MMENYGKGRLNAMLELLDWVEREIDEIKCIEKTQDTHANATLSGQVRAYSKVKQKLKVKINKTKLRNDE